jgi:hypothetical protein
MRVQFPKRKIMGSPSVSPPSATSWTPSLMPLSSSKM